MIKNKKSRYIILGLCLSFITLINTPRVYASVEEIKNWFTARDEVSNNFINGDIDISIEEDFKEPENWDGLNHDKKVAIQNNGKSDAFIRVSIVPRWVDENGKPWIGDSNYVDLTFVNVTEDLNTANAAWIKGEDGYYYYNQIVKTTNKTVDLLESVALNIPTDKKDVYKNRKLIVDVKSETVQATSNAYLKVWEGVPESIKIVLDRLLAN
ncbi:hypothetical protein [Clostridium septicum]|uniref:Alternate signal-mediated exported protein, CPF_0494 family n=1 Tax=Clostridium septicum TaxID=1504 RepID=A0A9N7PKP5_CLOSE|nr:hypothetical protein [Clostridium septicum]AYE33766.1 hypothetical protein CP523_04395 [Clostridium septicum]UEC21624.1 hypothetical protein LK444_04435 [Clostridium septicum]USS00326.1 hypothetical protein NH397_12640 [Clostridium septicum]WLF68877.1 hypothetical protein Q6375_12955 [Clostridium septicum]